MTDGASGITVVVPTLNRGRYLLDTVRDLAAQEHRPLEILIVDQSNSVSPELNALVAAHPEIVHHHRVSFRGLPSARNYGWQQARYELVIYVDDDIRCGPDFVGRYQRAFESEQIAILGGGVQEGDGSDPNGDLPRYDRWRAIHRGSITTMRRGRSQNVKGCNFAARRVVLRGVGGVDESLAIGAALHEETDLALRALEAGWEVHFDGTIRLDHRVASHGGTRQRDARSYVYALGHNRSVMIRRHSRWYQWPVALGWSIKLFAAHAAHHRDPGVLLAGVRGALLGWRAGIREPLCTMHGRQHARFASR